jgi:non-heme chloroperoxidase
MRACCMGFLVIGVLCFAGLVAVGLAFVLALVASPRPKIEKLRDVFGFSAVKSIARDDDVPVLERYPARDGEELVYRIYESSSARLVIFLHGSSYHGAGYHALASAVSRSGSAKVVLPNLRGHFLSGRQRGDVGYIGQLEDDLVDLIRFLRGRGLQGEIVLGGHSSGAGLAIRFAGGGHGEVISNFMLLSPVIPTSPAVRPAAGGWAILHARRLYGLLIFNALGIHGLDDLPIIQFNKPPELWDGTETLSYSYRLNASYHPRYRYADDIRALGDKALVLVGADDEAVDPEALTLLFSKNAPGSRVMILPKISHFGVFTDTIALHTITKFLGSLRGENAS